MKSLHVCCLIAAAALLAKSNAQNFLVNFDTPGDFVNNFNVYQNVNGGTVSMTGSPYVESTTGGVNNSGSVSVTQGTGITGDSTAIYKNASFNFANSGNSQGISAMMQVIPPTETGNRLLQLGFVNDPTSGMNGNANLAFTSMRFNPSAIGSLTYSPQWQTKTAAGGTVNTAGTFVGGATTITFVQGDWYLYSLTFVNNGSGNIGASGFIQDMGTTGTTPGTVTTLNSVTLASVDIAADPTTYAAFRGFNADGLAKVDNLQATTSVPEPTTMALLGLAGLATVMARRRR